MRGVNMSENVIVAATGNEHKLKEIREILKGYTVISAKEAGHTTIKV